MNPLDFQSLAAGLAAGNTAAHCRSSVSRSYYAAFNVGAEILRGLGFAVGKGAAAHGEVVQCLSNCGDREVAGVAYQLSDLHSARNRADYQLDRKDVEQSVTAQAIAAQAGAMISVLDRLFSGPQAPQLQTAIRAWRKENGYP